MTLFGGFLFNLFKWGIAYLIEVIKGDPELADLVKKNKWIFLLTIMVLCLFAAVVFQYTNFIKADEALKKLRIANEAVVVEQRTVLKQYAENITDHRITQARIKHLEGLYDARTVDMNHAIEEARQLHETVEQKDHIIAGLLNEKDVVLRERLITKLDHLMKEYGR